MTIGYQIGQPAKAFGDFTVNGKLTVENGLKVENDGANIIGTVVITGEIWSGHIHSVGALDVHGNITTEGSVQTGCGPLPVVQKTGACFAKSATAVHAAVTLSGSPQTVTTSITNPDVYRGVTVKGSQAGITENVTISGTNWAGVGITETIALSGESEVAGVKPFKTVTRIDLPAKTNGSGDTVSVGISDKLGLYRPIAVTGDLIEVAVAPGNSYFILGSVGTVDATNGTVLPGTITAGDKYQISYNTSVL